MLHNADFHHLWTDDRRALALSRVTPAVGGAPYPDERDELLAGVFIRAAESFKQSQDEERRQPSDIKGTTDAS